MHSAAKWKTSFIRLATLPIAVLICALSSLAIQHASFKPAELEAAISNYQQVDAEFEALDRPNNFGAQIYSVGSANSIVGIRLQSVELESDAFPVFARGKFAFDSKAHQIAPGQRMRCRLQLSPSRNYEREAFTGRCVGELQLLSAPPKSIFEDLRLNFLKIDTGVNGDASGLVAGLAIGDTSGISEPLRQSMRAVSLTHLTAVSGANCVIVLGLVFALIRQLGANRWLRLSVGLATLAFYVCLVGPAPSVLRAAVMSAAIMIGASLGRRSNPMQALALAVIVLLIADPWLAIDFGFALSVGATAGILLLGKPFYEKLKQKLPKVIALATAVAISAQVMCLPILLQLQGSLSTYSVIANVLAESLVAPVTIFGLLACLLVGWIPMAGHLCFYLASLGAWLIAEIAKYFSNLPKNSIAWPLGGPGLGLSVLVIVAIFFWVRTDSKQLQNIGKGLLVMVAAATLAFFGKSSISQLVWQSKPWNVVACDVGQGDGMVVKSKDSIAVIDVGREPAAISSCLNKLGVHRIDLLVLTHFDTDHIGGINGVLNNFEIKSALLSPFPDQRWSAAGTIRQLQSINAEIHYGEAGMAGTLGATTWSVLNPNHSAAGAEDSNDGSLVIWFEFGKFNLLTMADIGERGQMRISADAGWISRIKAKPLVLKVAHHGSADQYPELLEELHPAISLISAGAGNSYGHPTQRTLQLLERSGSKVLRTDLLGSISISQNGKGIEFAAEGVG